MMLRSVKFLFLVSISIAVSGCGEKPELVGEVIALGSVESVVSSVNSGTVRAEQQAELAFGAVGRVETLNIKLGDTAKKGMILAELENSDMKVSLAYLQREAARRKDLASKKLISATEFEDVTRQVDISAAALEKTMIRAPFDGIVTELNLEVGQLSQITAVIPKPLVGLVDQAPRYVRAEIDELDLGKLAVGAPARVKVLTNRREAFPATVRQVVPFISTMREQDRTAEIELNVDANGALLPVGASADVEVIIEHKDKVLVAPSKAVLGRKDARYVFKYERGKAIKTAVTTGVTGYDKMEILSGLAENDTVLIPSSDIPILDGVAVKLKKP